MYRKAHVAAVKYLAKCRQSDAGALETGLPASRVGYRDKKSPGKKIVDFQILSIY
jgi:hypothetical protein